MKRDEKKTQTGHGGKGGVGETKRSTTGQAETTELLPREKLKKNAKAKGEPGGGGGKQKKGNLTDKIIPEEMAGTLGTRNWTPGVTWSLRLKNPK